MWCYWCWQKLMILTVRTFATLYGLLLMLFQHTVLSLPLRLLIICILFFYVFYTCCNTNCPTGTQIKLNLNLNLKVGLHAESSLCLPPPCVFFWTFRPNLNIFFFYLCVVIQEKIKTDKKSYMAKFCCCRGTTGLWWQCSLQHTSKKKEYMESNMSILMLYLHTYIQIYIYIYIYI